MPLRLKQHKAPSARAVLEPSLLSAFAGNLSRLDLSVANEILEKVAGYGLTANIVIYLTKDYHLSNATAATVLFVWSAISDFAPIPGALLADMYLGRFRAVAYGSISCLIGMVFLWLTAMIPGARPPPCSDIAPAQCKQPAPGHLVLLLVGFAFSSIGAGGVRPCSMAFGADQFSRHPPEKKTRILQAYFNAYYASFGVAFMVALTAIVYVQDKVGWRAGFAVPMCLMLISVVSFLVGSSLYIKDKGTKQIFSGIGAAVVAAFKNYKAQLPAKTEEGLYHHLRNCKLCLPTDKLRFLNRACMICSSKDDARDTTTGASRGRRDTSALCTVDQVEQLKSTIRILPIWSSTIFIALTTNQNFAVLQADAMDRRVGRHGFRIPAGSFAAFSMVTMSLWAGSYDKWIAPALRRLTGSPCGLTLKQRIGGGVLLAAATMAASAIAESTRRRMALGGLTMSAFWLVPQFALMGLAEAVGVIGQVEFYYTELPKSMASFGMALLYMAMGMGNLAGSLLVRVADVVSRSGGKTSWLSSDLNKGHYDYYYWLLTGLGAVNFVYFVWCGWMYGEEGKNVPWEDDGGEKEFAVA